MTPPVSSTLNWKAASGLSLSLLSISVAPRSPGLISNVSTSLSPFLPPCRFIWISNTMSVQVKPGIGDIHPVERFEAVTGVDRGGAAAAVEETVERARVGGYDKSNGSPPPLTLPVIVL